MRPSPLPLPESGVDTSASVFGLTGISASFGDYTLQFQWTPISKKGLKCLYPVALVDPYKHLGNAAGAARGYHFLLSQFRGC